MRSRPRKPAIDNVNYCTQHSPAVSGSRRAADQLNALSQALQDVLMLLFANPGESTLPIEMQSRVVHGLDTRPWILTDATR